MGLDKGAAREELFEQLADPSLSEQATEQIARKLAILDSTEG